ncbi:hypothetical protein OB919_04185 [Halobacteria archaeon AArc-curdl1]|uniref:Uncharacterized protein n=1 Tax=Natronosalvus hydrolyticus TaxID=2979988 RepID=A0AAP2Z6S2_9EURY|nr:hypothetical protein [Halobacteria archaeon AArc-curdl1]
MNADQRSPIVLVVLIGSILVTGLVHLVFLPRVFPEELFVSSFYLFAGWISFTLIFYSLGRLFSNPGPMPRLGAADYGAGLFVLSILGSLFLDTLGFALSAVPEGHIPFAIGVYVGLALIGWSVGERTVAINQAVASSNNP